MRFLPLGRKKSATSVPAFYYIGLIKFCSIPKLTGHLLVKLIECLTVVCVSAPANLSAVSRAYFNKPVGICQRLAREPGYICIAVKKH
jgi:hypothetical protein